MYRRLVCMYTGSLAGQRELRMTVRGNRGERKENNGRPVAIGCAHLGCFTQTLCFTPYDTPKIRSNAQSPGGVSGVFLTKEDASAPRSEKPAPSYKGDTANAPPAQIRLKCRRGKSGLPAWKQQTPAATPRPFRNVPSLRSVWEARRSLCVALGAGLADILRRKAAVFLESGCDRARSLGRSGRGRRSPCLGRRAAKGCGSRESIRGLRSPDCRHRTRARSLRSRRRIACRSSASNIPRR